MLIIDLYLQVVRRTFFSIFLFKWNVCVLMILFTFKEYIFIFSWNIAFSAINTTFLKIVFSHQFQWIAKIYEKCTHILLIIFSYIEHTFLYSLKIRIQLRSFVSHQKISFCFGKWETFFWYVTFIFVSIVL